MSVKFTFCILILIHSVPRTKLFGFLFMAGALWALCFVITHWTWKGTDFLGSICRTRGRKEKRMVAPLRDKKSLRYATVDLIFSFIDLEPDGCLVADQFRIRTNNFWNHGRRQRKGADPVSGWCPCKKKCTFLRWWSVFSWQGPFNGCHSQQFDRYRNRWWYVLDIIWFLGLSNSW